MRLFAAIGVITVALLFSGCTVSYTRSNDNVQPVAEQPAVRIGEICTDFTFDEEVDMLKRISDERVSSLPVRRFLVDDRTRADVLTCYGNLMDFYGSGNYVSVEGDQMEVYYSKAS